MGINDMTITSAQERHKKRDVGIEIRFPEYEDWVAIRPMDESFFFKHGMIPDFLAPFINEMIATGQAKMPTVEKNEEWLKFLDDLVRFAYVNPKVVDDPQADNEISIDEVGYADKCFLYGLFGRPAHILRAFRDQQAKPVATVPDGKVNGRPAVEIVKNNAVGQ